jgi:hypothetical protein
VLETPHVAVGAAIATKVTNPVLSLPLAFASHFILEKVPHWNPHLNSEKKQYGKVTPNSTKIVVIDSTLALSSGLYIAMAYGQSPQHSLIIIAASFLSVLPDVIEAPYLFLNVKSKFIQRWMALQKSLQENAALVPGLLTQILVYFAALWWIAT